MKDPRRDIGKRGERLAERYLKRRGLRTVERNLRRRSGEIDLLMRDGEELVVVEVRTLTREGGIDASDRIPPGKRRQVARVARELLAGLDDPPPPVRFDVCIVLLEPKPRVTHIPDAFRVDKL